jgi:hypothetical protein
MSDNRPLRPIETHQPRADAAARQEPPLPSRREHARRRAAESLAHEDTQRQLAAALLDANQAHALVRQLADQLARSGETVDRLVAAQIEDRQTIAAARAQQQIDTFSIRASFRVQGDLESARHSAHAAEDHAALRTMEANNLSRDLALANRSILDLGVANGLLRAQLETRQNTDGPRASPSPGPGPYRFPLQSPARSQSGSPAARSAHAGRQPEDQGSLAAQTARAQTFTVSPPRPAGAPTSDSSGSESGTKHHRAE